MRAAQGRSNPSDVEAWNKRKRTRLCATPAPGWNERVERVPAPKGQNHKSMQQPVGKTGDGCVRGENDELPTAREMG